MGCAFIPMAGDAATDAKVHSEATLVGRCPLIGSAPNYVQFQSEFQDTARGAMDIVIDSETLQFLTSVGLEHFNDAIQRRDLGAPF